MSNPIRLTPSKLFAFTPSCQAVTKKPAGANGKVGLDGKT